MHRHLEGEAFGGGEVECAESTIDVQHRHHAAARAAQIRHRRKKAGSVAVLLDARDRVVHLAYARTESVGTGEEHAGSVDSRGALEV